MLKLYKNLKAQDWVLVVLIVGITVAQVYFTMELTDKIADIVSAIRQVSMHVPGATTGDIWREGGLMLAFAVCSALCQVASGIAASRVASGLSATLRSKVYAKVESFSVAEINKFSTSSLITRTTNDIQQVQLANILVLRMLIYAPIMAIWAICKINASSWQLTTATAVAVVVLVVCIIAIMLTVMPKFRMMQKLTDRLNGVTRENLTGIKVVRAYNAENYQEAKFEKANDDFTKTQLFTGRVMALMNPVMMLTMNGLTLAIYWIGATLMNRGAIEYETILSFANNVHTPEGGTHEEGFKLALTRALNEYARAKGILKDKDENLSGPDAREGVIAVISVKLQEAQFEGQTKAKLGNTFIKGLVSNLVYKALSEFFEENPAAAKAIQAIRTISKQVGIPANLKQLGVKPEDFETMAENAMKDVCCLTNPRKATKEQIIEIYRRAYEGE